jgi:hypothetical protein
MIEPRELEQKLDAYGATLPPQTYESGGEKHAFPQDGESIVGDLLTAYLLARDLRKALKRRLLFTKAGKAGIFQTKTIAPAHAHLLRDEAKARALLRDADKVLNFLPEPEALALYRTAA